MFHMWRSTLHPRWGSVSAEGGAFLSADFKRMKQRIGYAVQTPLANAELFDLLLAPRTMAGSWAPPLQSSFPF